MPRKFQRRKYENVALVAVRKTRELVLFWARRCRKSTNLGTIAFDEMSGERGRTVIGASASLLLGKEIVGMTLGSAEQAEIVTKEAAAMREVFDQGAADRGLNLQVADVVKDKVYQGLSADDFAGLYKSSSMEMRLYFDRTAYSRLKIIAPNPATARGWGGTVLRDEAGYTPANLEQELRIATKPIMDTDPTFKLVYASNLCPNDRHPFFRKMTMPPGGRARHTERGEDLYDAKAGGHFYPGPGWGLLVHRVSLADAYAAGHVLYDDKGKELSLESFRKLPGNKLGMDINYDLLHRSGGAAAIDLMALLTAQRRGATECCFAFVDSDVEFRGVVNLMRGLLKDGRVGIGFDVASTTGETSNPSSITVTEQIGVERYQRLVVLFKSKQRAVMVERLAAIVRAVRERKAGGPARRLCIDATNERLAAEETQDELRGLIPVELVIASLRVEPPGYQEPTNYKTYLGDLYSTAVNEGRYALPAADYIKTDQRLVVKNAGRYECAPEPDGKHGDTFDSGKLAEYALATVGGTISHAIPAAMGSYQGGSN